MLQLSFVLARVHTSVVGTALFILELEAALGQQGTASRYQPVTGRTSDLVYINQQPAGELIHNTTNIKKYLDDLRLPWATGAAGVLDV